MNDAPLLHCSFCNKSQKYVKTFIAGPKVQICNECIEICQDILNEDRKDLHVRVPSTNVPSLTSAVLCSLCFMPTPEDEALLIESRGVLCPGRVGAIEAAVAESRKGTD